MMGTLQTTIVIALEETKDDFWNSLVDALKIIFACLSPQFGVTYWGVKFARKAVDNYNINAMGNIKTHSMCMTDNPNPCCFGDTEACAAEKSYWGDSNIQLICTLTGMIFYLMLNIWYNNYTIKLKLHKLYKLYSQLFSRNENNNTLQLEEVVKKPMENNGLCIHKLTKYYGKKTPAVNIENLNLTKGECVGILGMNGAGKSTTFRILTKQEVCDEASIEIRKNIENEQENGIIKINDDQVYSTIIYN